MTHTKPSHLLYFQGVEGIPIKTVYEDLKEGMINLFQDLNDHMKQRWCPDNHNHSYHEGDLRRLKREQVQFNVRTNDRCMVIGKERESVGELMNQLATVEIMFCVLDEFMNKFPRIMVEECHPTTSSQEQGTPEGPARPRDKGHDLILRQRGGVSDVLHCVEISDVMGTGNNNKKIDKDLETLANSHQMHAEGGPHHFYLACSPESQKHLYRSKGWKKEFAARIDDPHTNSSKTCFLNEVPCDILQKIQESKKT
ncbi:MAG: hypothetical protein M1318_05655 [Firmicutes bacterium]|nr:hypothetical protein [Bacillota bacterium]